MKVQADVDRELSSIYKALLCIDRKDETKVSELQARVKSLVQRVDEVVNRLTNSDEWSPLLSWLWALTGSLRGMESLAMKVQSFPETWAKLMGYVVGCQEKNYRDMEVLFLDHFFPE